MERKGVSVEERVLQSSSPWLLRDAMGATNSQLVSAVLEQMAFEFSARLSHRHAG